MTYDNGLRRAVRMLLAAAVGVAGLPGPATAAPLTAAPAAPLTAAAARSVPSNTGRAITGRYVVVLDPASRAAAQVTTASLALAKRYGGTVRGNYLTAVRGFAVDMSAAAAKRLAADPSVQYVEQDRVVTLAATATAATWGLDRIDQATLPLSNTYTSGSASGVTAYVLDTGIRTSHTEFGGRAGNGWDFIDGDPVANDCNGHGTHVAGTIGGATSGVAKDVKVVAVRVLDCQGSGSYSQIIAAVDWVAAHAVRPAVANMSLGGPADKGLNDAVKRSVASGVTYAVAAGNSNEDACSQSPAGADTAITVGATTSTDARASFSNHGSCLDIFAPGSRITSAGHSSDTGMAMMSGTSMAAPHVAGAAALVLGGNPHYTAAQVTDALGTNATRDVVTSPGTGSPNRLLNTGWLNPAVQPPPTASPAPASPAPASPAPASPAPVTTPPGVTPVPTLSSPPVVTPVPTQTTKPVVTPVPTQPVVTPPPVVPVPCGPFTNRARVFIGDLRTVRSAVSVAGCAGRASSRTRVDATIEHGNRGGLEVVLIAPDGRRYPLTAARVAASRGLTVTYVVDAGASPRNGSWALQVRDKVRRNVGYLTSWAIRP